MKFVEDHQRLDAPWAVDLLEERGRAREQQAVFGDIVVPVTVYSRQADVAVQYAPPEVLSLLPNINRELIPLYLKMRMDSALQGLPTPPFPTSNRTSQLNRSDTGEQPTDAVIDDVPITTIISQVQMNDGSTATLQATIEKSIDGFGEPFHTLAWQTNPANASDLFADSFNTSIINHYVQPELTR